MRNPDTGIIFRDNHSVKVVNSGKRGIGVKKGNLDFHPAMRFDASARSGIFQRLTTRNEWSGYRGDETTLFKYF